MESQEEPITFSDLGIDTRATTTDTFLGKVRNCSSLSWKEIVFLVGAVTAILVVIGLTIERLTIVDKASPDFTFAIVMLINSGCPTFDEANIYNIDPPSVGEDTDEDNGEEDGGVFCLYYVLNGVYFERPHELAAFVLATGVVWFYIILNYAVNSDRGPYKTGRLVVACLTSPFLIGMGGILAYSYNQSKNLIFRTVGALPAIQDICDKMYIFFCLMKGDLQLSVTGAVLIMTNGNRLDLEDKILLPCVIVVGLVSLVLGYFSVRLENKCLMIVNAVTWMLIPLYAGYLTTKSARIIDAADTSADKAIGAVTIVTAAAMFVVRGMLALFGCKVYNNFGKGLKQKVFDADEDVQHTDTA